MKYVHDHAGCSLWVHATSLLATRLERYPYVRL